MRDIIKWLWTVNWYQAERHRVVKKFYHPICPPSLPITPQPWFLYINLYVVIKKEKNCHRWGLMNGRQFSRSYVFFRYNFFSICSSIKLFHNVIIRVYDFVIGSRLGLEIISGFYRFLFFFWLINAVLLKKKNCSVFTWLINKLN